MKSLAFVILFTAFLLPPSLFAQGENLYPIEFQKRKMLYQGKQIGKKGTKKLRTILKEAKDAEVNKLYKSYQGIQYLAMVPAAAGIGFSIAGISKLSEDNTLEELSQAQKLTSTGVGLVISGLIINLVAWPLKGKKAINRYNEVVESQKGLSQASLRIIPSTHSLGVGLTVKF